MGRDYYYKVTETAPDEDETPVLWTVGKDNDNGEFVPKIDCISEEEAQAQTMYWNHGDLHPLLEGFANSFHSIVTQCTDNWKLMEAYSEFERRFTGIVPIK